MIETLVPDGDSTNHYVSVAVQAALFAVAAAACYAAAWRRTERLGEFDPGAGLDRLRSGYGYLVAGLAAVASLVFAPLSANNVFRAIAPGVTGADGHADGLRNLVTFVVLLAMSLLILRAHLRLAAGPTPVPLDGAAPPPDSDGD